MNLPQEKNKYLIGFKIKEKRIEKGLKQADLSERLEISQASLSRIENDGEDIGFQKLVQLAQILETPLSYFTSVPSQIQNLNNRIENSNGEFLSQEDKSNIVEELKFIIQEKQELIAAYKNIINILNPKEK